ncbi:response regulator [soil metagenome]
METRPKILIVDDRPENLVALEVVLRDLDVDLVRATSGNEALRSTLYNDFALALLDIQMPEMDGYELASLLRDEERTANMPFIFISAVYTDHINIFKGYEQGAFSFITKPFQPEILINKVKFFIEKHQQEISLQELNLTLEQKNNDLVEMNQDLESFSFSVSHDLRAPVRTIVGFAKILEAEYGSELSKDAKNMLDLIVASGYRMSQLIDDLLNFSKLGRKEVKLQPVNMQLLTQQAVEEVQREMESEAHITIGPLPTVEADPSLMMHVLKNLISNAVKYSRKVEAPLVDIQAKEEVERVVFSIKDNGAGFDMRFASKLFIVFQRLHTTSEFEGSGVGLAIVHRIITKHHGHIWAESSPNQGATFYFSIPA